MSDKIRHYNPDIHHRKSIRLKGYDYSQAGFYFITICVQNHAYLFGEIIDETMKLNDAGQMIKKWYYELENKFNDIKCHEMIVMPNHFHCIIQNTIPTVGADLRVCPSQPHVCSSQPHVCPSQICPNSLDKHSNVLQQRTLGEHVGSPLQCGDVN